MDIGSILFILAIFILVCLFILSPFFAKKSLAVELENKVDLEKIGLELQYSGLLAEKERLLNILQELEIDHNMGKIPDEDYPEQRTNLLAAGARVLHKLDNLQEMLQKNPLDDVAESQGTGLEEGEISVVHQSEMDVIEEMVSTRRRLRDEKSAGFCPRCGKVIQKSDAYCPQCGSKVAD